MIIKALLLIALCCAGLLSLRSDSRTVGPALRRLTAVLLLALGALSVLFPSIVTVVANAVGVGRGTDLVVYVLAVTSLFGWIGTYKRLHELEDRTVVLARSAALGEGAYTAGLPVVPGRPPAAGDSLTTPASEKLSPRASLRRTS